MRLTNWGVGAVRYLIEHNIKLLHGQIGAKHILVSGRLEVLGDTIQAI